MNIDTSLFTFLNSFAGKSHLSDSIISFVGDKISYLLILVFLIFVLRFASEKKKAFLTAVVSTVISRGIVTELIRFLYHRPRPFSVMNVNQLIYEKNWSFPSGHAAFFFALATAVYFYNKKWGVFFFIATFFLSIGRVIGGVHYPSDILGGAIIGIATAYLVKRYIFKSPKTL